MTDKELIEKLTEQNDKFREELARLYGIERLFICGQVGDKGEDNMPEYVLVSPEYGSEHFSLYKRFRDIDIT